MDIKADKRDLASVAIVVFAFIVSFYAYNISPDSVATHWNAKGEVDGYMGKTAGLYIIPCVMAAIFAFLYVIPYIDPLRSNIECFIISYKNFVVFFMAFLLLIHIQSVLWNLGVKINPISTMPPLLGMLFYLAGDMMEKSKRNYFIGFRTPWTLSSDAVWEKTNKLGGRIFKACGILSVGGIFLGEYGLFLVIVPVLLGSLYVTAYSYIEHKKERK